MSRSVIRERGRVGTPLRTSDFPNATRSLITDRALTHVSARRRVPRSVTVVVKGSVVALATAGLVTAVALAPDWGIFAAIVGWLTACVLVAAED